MNEIAQQIKSNLPETIEEKTKYVLFGMEALKIYRAKLKAMEKAGISKEQYDQLKMEAQETAENLLLFSADIGKELEKVDKASGGDRRSEKFKIDGNVKNEKTKPETIHEMGFTDRQARDFQTLAQHPEVVQQAIKDARENDRIVTRADVLNRIAPPQSHQQTMKEIEKKARAEHQEFKEKKKDSVVSFEDIQRDKQSQNIINHSIKSGIMGAIKAISNISFLNASEVNEMVETSTKEDLEWMRNALLNSIETLSFLYHKFGG